jgi:hypothetical protein
MVLSFSGFVKIYLFKTSVEIRWVQFGISCFQMFFLMLMRHEYIKNYISWRGFDNSIPDDENEGKKRSGFRVICEVF